MYALYHILSGANDVTFYVCVDIAKTNPHATEMNVLVVGMPNVGKSTLLNSLRSFGIAGRTSRRPCLFFLWPAVFDRTFL